MSLIGAPAIVGAESRVKTHNDENDTPKATKIRLDLTHTAILVIYFIVRFLGVWIGPVAQVVRAHP